MFVNLKNKIQELESNNKINLYKGINDFKKGYQLRINRVNDDEFNLSLACKSILASWRNYFSQPFNLQSFSNVMQTEIHTTDH